MSARRSPVPAIVVGLIAAAIFFVLGVYLGGHSSGLPGPLRDLAGNRNDRVVSQALSIIEHDYYRKVSPSRLANTGLQAAVHSLDDQFSHYFDPATFRQFEAQTTNPQFSGVGLNVVQDPRGLKVVSVIPSTPASRSGIQAGDYITAVNGASLAGKPSTLSTALIKGQPGTEVSLTVLSGGHRVVKRLRREEVTVPIVSSKLLTYHGQKLGYVELSMFSASAGDQVRSAVTRRLDQGARGIVLDLRGNPGGLLDEAVAVASVFIPDGPVVSTDGRARPRHIYDATGGAIPASIPVAVLVDRGSASSSEIVTGALQDRHRAKIVGTRTFGKGVFQEIRQLSNGGALDITVGEFFTPSGRNLGGGGVKEGAGITPDIAVPEAKHPRSDTALAVAERTLAGELK